MFVFFSERLLCNFVIVDWFKLECNLSVLIHDLYNPIISDIKVSKEKKTYWCIENFTTLMLFLYNYIALVWYTSII